MARAVGASIVLNPYAVSPSHLEAWWAQAEQWQAPTHAVRCRGCRLVMRAMTAADVATLARCHRAKCMEDSMTR